MAVIKITERGDARDGKWTALSGRTYTRTWDVLTDNSHDGPVTVLTAMGFRNGDRYRTDREYDGAAFLMELGATVDAPGGKNWKVVASYGPYDATAQGDPDNPLNDPIEVNWGFKAVEEVVEIDRNGNQILNTAGEKFDPPVTQDRQVPTLTIVRNESLDGFSLPAIKAYVGAINSDSFAGWGAGMAKCANILPKRVHNATIGFYLQVQYDFEFDAKGWNRKVPSLGMRQLSTDKSRLEQIYIQGTAATNPVLLDKNGRMLPPGADPYVLEFQTRTPLAFIAFNFSEDVLTGQA